MNKLLKIVSVLVMIVMIVSVSLSVNAYTNDNVIEYISKAHTVNGRTVQLSKTQRQSLTQYLQNNPVTESEADEIIGKLDSAKSKLDNSGATNLSQLSDSIKAEVVSLVKSAGSIAGLNVEVDTVNEVVTIKDSNGNSVVSATSYSQFNKNPNKTNSTTNADNKQDNSNTNNSATNSTVTNTKKDSVPKLVYTGRNYSVAKIIVAIVAVAIVGIVVKKYAK